jgi:hypothetical protein
MKGANLGNLLIAGSSEPADPAWLSISDIVDIVRVRGVEVSERQLERWRDRRLLPPGAQEFEAPGHGGVYKFPPVTIDLAVAIHHALFEKDDLEWVGRQLWWRGFPMDERCWRPLLLDAAKTSDRALRFIATQVRGERDDGDDASRDDTLADRIAPKFASKNNAASILASRIMGRVSPGELPYILRLILETASGFDPQFVLGSAPADELSLIRALDLSVIKKDPVTEEQAYIDDMLAGKRFRFREAVGPVLADLAAGIQNASLVDAANASRTELECARDDLIMEFVPELYRATKWIYGPKAFGLRFASWISVKRPERLLNIWLLLWVLLRRVSAEIISSDEINNLHSTTMEFARNLTLLKEISSQYSDRHNWLKPENLRKALSDKILFGEFVIKLRSSNFPFRAEQSISG